MIELLNFATFLLGFVCTLISLRRVLKSQYSFLHVCVIVFFLIQILPLIVDYFNDVTLLQNKAKYEYLAMIDEKTSIIYDIFCCFTSLLLLKIANRYSRKTLKINFSKIRVSPIVSYLLFILMFCPLIGVLFSPYPNVYYYFSYFYTQSSINNISYIYHNSVLLYINYIAFFSILCYYFFNSNSKFSRISTLIASILLIWVDGKRGFLALIIVGVLFIDFIKNRQNKKDLIKKTLILIVVFFGYFVIYSSLTGKHSDDSFYLTYNAYFSREAEVKLAIYSRLPNHTKMLPYDGASLIYNMVAVCPRSFWPDKPYGFFNYLTSYAYFGSGDEFLSFSNYQVNIWSEFIANLGIIGYLISIIFVTTIIRLSERSQHKVINLLGGLFVLAYLFLGFEMIVMLLFYIWLLLYVLYRKKPV